MSQEPSPATYGRYSEAAGLLRARADEEAKDLAEEPFHAGGFITNDRIKMYRAAADLLDSAPSETLHKPVAWIADNGAGKTLHFAKADGWTIEAVQSLPAETTLSAIREISLGGCAPKLYGSTSPLGALGAFGLVVLSDPDLPDDVMEFRDGVTGRVLAKIVNVGKS